MDDSLEAANGNEENPTLAILRAIHGDDVGEFIGRHHVRFLKQGTVYHVLSRVAGGMALLVPTEEVNRIIAGVMARALAHYPEVKLYGFA